MPRPLLFGLSRLATISAVAMAAVAYAQVPPSGHRFSWWLFSFEGGHWLRQVATFAVVPLFALSVLSPGFAWCGAAMWVGLGFVAAADQSPFALLAWLVGGAFLVLALRLTAASRRMPAVPATGSHGTDSGHVEAPGSDAAPYVARRSNASLEDVLGMTELKVHLRSCMSQWQAGNGNGLLLYGPPGNGKTSIAEAVAGSLGLPVISVSIADLGSKWLGQSTQELKSVMRSARAQAPCVLFLDEVDSVLGSRDMADSHQDRRDLTNAFLAEVSTTQAHRVLVVAATNFIDKLDAAAIRDGRFDWRVEVPDPDFDARAGLLKAGLRKSSPTLDIDDEVVSQAAARWAGFSAARILGIARRASEAANGSGHLSYDHLHRALRLVQGAQASAPAAGDLAPGSLDATAYLKARSLARRLLAGAAGVGTGATFPHGIIALAPTQARARATLRDIACHAGYFWLEIGIADFERPESLATKVSRAKDMRPCAVFIDGASDIFAADPFARYRAGLLALLAELDAISRDRIDVTFMAGLSTAAGLDRLVRQEGRFADLLDLGADAQLDVNEFALRFANSRGWGINAGGLALLKQFSDLSEEQISGWVQEAINLAVGAEDVLLEQRVLSESLLGSALQTVGFNR